MKGNLFVKNFASFSLTSFSLFSQDCIEPPCTRKEDLRVSSSTPKNSGGVLGGVRLKSDSLDSSKAACCNNLAFNFYNKALESAKKALPKYEFL